MLYKCHTDSVHDVLWSKTSNEFYSVARDGKLIIWDLRRNDKPIKQLSHPDAVTRVLCNDKQTISFCTDGTMFFYNPKTYQFNYYIGTQSKHVNDACMEENIIVTSGGDSTLRVLGFDTRGNNKIAKTQIKPHSNKSMRSGPVKKSNNMK